MAVIVTDTTNYFCYPNIAAFQALQQYITFYVGEVVDAYTVPTEDGFECTMTDEAFQNMITTILQFWGFAALQLPMNRAVYPLPEGNAVIVDV